MSVMFDTSIETISPELFINTGTKLLPAHCRWELAGWVSTPVSLRRRVWSAPLLSPLYCQWASVEYQRSWLHYLRTVIPDYQILTFY